MSENLWQITGNRWASPSPRAPQRSEKLDADRALS
jgi:hypothetical protein